MLVLWLQLSTWWSEDSAVLFHGVCTLPYLPECPVRAGVRIRVQLCCMPPLKQRICLKKPDARELPRSEALMDSSGSGLLLRASGGQSKSHL